MFRTKQSGFTLLELVIVIVVIGILAFLIVPQLLTGPARARDAQRKIDLRNIKTALENYYNEQGAYPTTLTALEGGSIPYIKTVPTDPKTRQNYTYIVTGNPPSGFILQTNLENKTDPDIKVGTKNTYEITSSNP
ncbi:prepilin-type N-terminal cleavage/methylation domain-containing protein [Candidatus Saccharibacteria bacterium]|nr:prepilin-type N-terminal cleavage/methylation domain-containing protein [Candidatus Saccharibacteria bacterium]